LITGALREKQFIRTQTIEFQVVKNPVTSLHTIRLRLVPLEAIFSP
jgi:hypothetical protein